MKKLKVIGLGAGDINQLPLGVYRSLVDTTHQVYLRTKDHPVVKELEKEGITFHYLDYIYEKHEKFEDVYEEIVTFLLEKAKGQEIVYAVPGHPLVAEKTVQLLLEKKAEGEVAIELVGGQSFLDSIFQALEIDPIDGFQLVDGTDLKREQLSFHNHLIIGQVYDSFSASEVKLTLMEILPYDYPVTIVTAAGSTDEIVKQLPLHELDREMSLNNLTSVYVPPVKDKQIVYKEFSTLRGIIAELRGPNGCPWDKKQTHESLRAYLLEESYELIEAINEGDIDSIIEELGDVLLQVLLHSQIGEDEGYFSIDDVIEGITAKMVRRHPHVFGEAIANTEEEVMMHWNAVKKEEKKVEKSSILASINRDASQLLQAYELQKKAAKVGFDWDDVEDAWQKVIEEIDEFREATKKEFTKEQKEKELGDILFSFVNIARFYKLHPELALQQSNQSFVKRFSYIENEIGSIGAKMEDMTLKQLDHYWDEAKKKGL